MKQSFTGYAAFSSRRTLTQIDDNEEEEIEDDLSLREVVQLFVAEYLRSNNF